jgi:hypothetical protein
MSIDAMKLALEALEHVHRTGDTQVFDLCYAKQVIPALRAAIEQPEQEPVAWTTMPDAEDWVFISGTSNPNGKLDGRWNPLYTAPPRREWQGLTSEEKHQLNDALNLQGRFPIIDAIEAKLREKNT